MSDIVLEQRVSTVEKNLKRIDRKLDHAIEQDHERLTRLEDVLAHFIKANETGLAELREEMAASERRMAEQLQRLVEQQQRSDARWTKWQQQMEEQQQRLTEQQQRTDANLAKWQKELTRSREEVGRLSHRLGTLVEDLVAPSLPRILRELVSCPDDTEVAVNVRLRRRHPTQPGQHLEIDATVDCGNYVLFNETKSQLMPEKVKAFVAKLATVREYFPEYQHSTILGSVSSLVVEASLIEYASRQGLLVLGTSEGLMELQNAPGFQWRTF